MRKIISIMLTLGLVLGLLAIAAPVSAKITGVASSAALPTVVLNVTDCAGCPGTYNITFNMSASLTQGFNKITIKFPAGTGVSVPVADGNIMLYGTSGSTPGAWKVFKSEVTVSNTTVTFVVPHDLDAGTTVTVKFSPYSTYWAITNPPAGKYTVWINTDRAPDSTPVESATYIVKPYYATYKFVWDSGPTYPGIAKGFVPPFKACGQNLSEIEGAGTDVEEWVGNITTIDAGNVSGFLNAFNLTFMTDVIGCNAPCDEVTISAELTKAPANATVTVEINDAVSVLRLPYPTYYPYIDDIGVVDLTGGSPATNVTQTWEIYIHFDKVGDYQICFYADCEPAVCPPPCCAAPQVPTQCFDIKVYQQKDAYKLTLCEKWNLFSLPLVPLGTTGSISITDALASISSSYRKLIVSIWNYDAFAPAWKVWTAAPPGGNLTTLEDGKAYWMRVAYPMSAYGLPSGMPYCCPITWWVWGTEKPEPPNPPSQYAVNIGWNMVGFTSTVVKNASVYLWNWAAAPAVVYGYTSDCWNVQNWELIPFTTGNLTPGDGYWIAFSKAGTVYVP